MSKANRILLILLAVQILLILFLENPWSSGRYRVEPEDREKTFLFPDFDISAVVSIDIRQGEKRILMESAPGEGQAWDIVSGGDRYRADRNNVMTLLTTLPRLKRLDVVSRNPDKADVYELDPAGAIAVQALDRDGKALASLLVGKNLGTISDTYVKLPGQDEVYKVSENVRRCCVKGDDWISAWRDKLIVTYERSEVKRIRVEGPGGVTVIERRAAEAGETETLEEGDPRPEASPVWWMTEPLEGRVTQRSGDGMAQMLSSLRAQGFADPGKAPGDVGLVDPEIVITVTYDLPEGERVVTFRLSAEREGQRFLMVDDDASALFQVPNFRFQPFLLKPEDLLAKPEETGDGG